MARSGREYDNTADDRRSFGRSGGMTALVIALLLLGFGVLWHAHQRAKFHKFTATVIPQTISAPMPGGQEALALSRVALVNDAEPEFESTTVLPGIGMQLLQITVAVPEQPTQGMLPPVSTSEAARLPREAVRSAPFHIHVASHHLQEKDMGEDLIGLLPASDATNQTLVDGGQASGKFTATGENSAITSEIEVTLSGRQIDLIARATNKSEGTRFVAFEWSPRFLAPSGDLARFGLSVPSRYVVDSAGRRVSGGPSSGFLTEAGQPVGEQPLDLQFASLGHDFLTDGTYIRLQSSNRFFLRMIGLGDTLRSVHARTDPATHTLLLNLSSMDPAADAEQHDQALRPGQTMQWHLRIEVLPVKTAQTPEPNPEPNR